MLIPAGEFQMGSDAIDAGKDEQPVHRVRISRPFYLGQYEVTQAEWEAVMETNPSRFKGRERPVENVSWADTQTFIQRLHAKKGHSKYRLPTEAEWEYAARAGTTTAFYDGNSLDATQANCGGAEPTPVGRYKPNSWVVYDMHGNVWEWVQDWYAGDSYKNSPAEDPQGPAPGSYRVNRGGSWYKYNYASYCRSAARSYVAPGGRYDGLGFRLLRTAP